MYLLDTNVISEIRKQGRANKGIARFFKTAVKGDFDLYLSVVTRNVDDFKGTGVRLLNPFSDE